MKRIIYSPASLASLEAILRWTIEQSGDEQAERHTGQLTARLKALAAGHPPRAKPCSKLAQGRRDAMGLSYYREGRHYLILRETENNLELVEVCHSQMNIEARLSDLDCH